METESTDAIGTAETMEAVTLIRHDADGMEHRKTHLIRKGDLPSLLSSYPEWRVVVDSTQNNSRE